MKIAFVLVFISASFPAGSATASDVDDFRREYGEAVAALRDHYRHSRAAGTLNETHRLPGELKSSREIVRKIHYVCQGDSEKMTDSTVKYEVQGKPQEILASEVVFIGTPGRRLAIKQPQPGNSYSLAEVASPGTGSIAESEPERLRKRFFEPAISLPGFHLPRLLGSPESSIDRVTRESRDGKTLVRVNYTIRPTDKNRPIQRGWALLQPDAGWSLQEFEAKTDGNAPVTYRGSVTYKPGVGQVPTPVLCKSDILYATGGTQSSVFSYEFFERATTPQSEFTLDAYGLGDADAPPSRRPLLFCGAIMSKALPNEQEGAPQINGGGLLGSPAKGLRPGSR